MSEKSPNYRLLIKVVVIIFFFLISIYFTYYLFWNIENIKIPIRNEATIDGFVLVTIDDGIFNDNAANAIRRLFQVPFNLNTFQICIRNRSTVGDTLGPVGVDVDFNIIESKSDRELSDPIHLSPYGEECIPFELQRKFRLKMIETKFNVDPDLVSKNTTLKFSPDISVNEAKGVYPSLNTKLISSFIFLVAYLTILDSLLIWTERIVKFFK